MSRATEEEIQRRRKSQTHGFSDHGDGEASPRRIRFADGTKPGTRRATKLESAAETVIPYVRLIWNIFLGILATLGIVGPLLILLCTAIRATQLLCEYHLIPQSTGICSSPWIAPPPSVLKSLKPGTTPLTPLLQEVSALASKSYVLEFVPLAMNTAHDNLNQVYPLLQSHADSIETEKFNLATFASQLKKTYKLMDRFSEREYDFRHQGLHWDDDTLSDLYQSHVGTLEHLGNSSRFAIAMQEMVFHNVPHAHSWSLSYFLGLEYFRFFQVVESDVYDLVVVATEARLKLEAAIAHMGILESRLQALAAEKKTVCGHINEGNVAEATSLCSWEPSHAADTVRMARFATQWTYLAFQFAERGYKRMYETIIRTGSALHQELQGHESWWMTKSALPLAKVEDIMKTENRQILGFVAVDEQAGGLVEEIVNKMKKGERDEEEVRAKHEAAMVEGRLEWW